MKIQIHHYYPQGKHQIPKLFGLCVLILLCCFLIIDVNSGAFLVRNQQLTEEDITFLNEY